MPANADILYQIIYKVATFDLPLIGQVTDALKEKLASLVQKEDHPVQDDRRRLEASSRVAGYESSNPFVNSAFAIVMIVLIIVILLVLVLLRIVFQKSKAVQNIYQQIKQKIFWGVFIRYLLENFLSFSIAYSLKMYALDFSSTSGSLISIYSMVIVALFFASPFIVSSFLFKKFDDEVINSDEFRAKHGEWIKRVHGNSKISLLFNAIFMVRRIIMAILIVVLPNVNWL